LRAGEVLSVAMREDSDRRWHKFRIAVKEVRYVAEAAASDNEQAADIAQSCRELQTLLGDWHDTVVQLNLLQDLEPAPVHQLLETLVRQRQQDFMSRMHASMEQESLFATPRTDP
jgi:CHAD domain-containing protein